MCTNIMFDRLSDHRKYTRSGLQRVQNAKETTRYKWVLAVTELFNIAINDFDAKKYAGHNSLQAGPNVTIAKVVYHTVGEQKSSWRVKP